MQPLTLSLLASDQARWLTARQKIISENVANSDTPGYRAADLQSFSDSLHRTGLEMQSTHHGHLADPGGFAKAVVKRDAEFWDVNHSGNTVSIDQQMLKANEVHRDYSINTSVLRAFSRMLTLSSKVGS